MAGKRVQKARSKRETGKKYPVEPAELHPAGGRNQEESINALQNRVGNQAVHRLLAQRDSNGQSWDRAGIDRTLVSSGLVAQRRPALQLQAEGETAPVTSSALRTEHAGNEALAQAIAAGVRNENKLTDLVFNTRHLERGGQGIDPKREKGLVEEWKTIQDKEVKPALEKAQESVPSEQEQTVEEKAPAARLSGADWVKEYPTSKVTDTLVDPFKVNVESFIKMLEANGAKVTISATYRPPERAYLMHYAWLIANGKIKYGGYPVSDPYGINILWDHGSEEASRAAAQEMVNGYKMAHPAVLKSRHTEGRAIDMTITRLPKSLKLSDEITVEIGSDLAETNSALWKVAAEHFSVHKLPKDPPHWSDDGH